MQKIARPFARGRFSSTAANVVKSSSGTVAVDSAHFDANLRTSQLENGTKVVSKDYGGSAAQITFLYKDGPQHENVFTAGASQFMKFALTKDSLTSSEFVTKTMLGKAGVVVAPPGIVGRSHISLSCGGNRDTLAQPAVLDKFWQSLLFPRFTADDAKEVARLAALETAELKQDRPTAWLRDLAHRTAFRGSPLGHSLYAPAYNAHAFSGEALFERWEQLYGFANIAVVATNVNHHDLLDALTDTPWLARAHAKVGGTATPPSAYVGGEAYDVHHRALEYDDQFTAVHDAYTCLAFKAPGLANVGDWAAATVVATALRNAVAPVLRNRFARAPAEVFYDAHAEVGLLGVMRPSATADQLRQVRAAIEGFAKVSEQDAATLVQAAQLAILSDAETSVGAHQLLLNSMASVGAPLDSDGAVAAVAGVSSAAIHRVAKEMLAAPLTLVNYGADPAAPSLAQL
eukprot:TRINITY_DN10411_c0_g1_i2.p1 TRINITY_DN10411_c0_g1~~TRINITY_DN10411_c0_g1_i2.p1  ORF type:complete len:459 (+),score=88.74 TRINITY_DN10411_c0_g1_i2:74-1450(+)